MKKRILAMFLSVMMLFSLLPMEAFAIDGEEGGGEDPIVETTPAPTEEPTPTPAVTEESSPTPAATEEPTPTPVATEEPTPTPVATEEPTPTPAPTAEAGDSTPSPTQEPTPEVTAEPTATPEPVVCTCVETCTEERINPFCEVCGAEGADLSACAGEDSAAAYVSYSLWVNGARVSDTNASSLADGKASYDAETNTLYIKGGMFNKSINNSDGYPTIIYYAGTDPLTITVTGNNTVSTLTNSGNWTGADGAYAIWSGAPLTINGTGYLDARGGTGIYVNGGVTIGSDVHIAAESKVNTKAIVATSYSFPYAEYDKEDGEYDFNPWRTDESVVEFESWAKSVTMGKFFEMRGEFHSYKRTDNKDGATHKFGCSCGIVYVSAENHNSTGTTCGCGLPLAQVTLGSGSPKSYLSLAEALNTAAAATSSDVIDIYAMTLTENATLGSGDYLDVGLSNSVEGRDLTVANGVTLTLEAGSKIHLHKNKVILEGTGRIVDNGAEIWYFQSYDRQHIHSTTTTYETAGETKHTKTVACNNCPIGHVVSTTLEDHTSNGAGACQHCGEEMGPAVIASGTCGDDLDWTLTDDGVLTITGCGEMTSYRWSKYKSQITAINLPEGLTKICDYAFADCSGLTSITIPDSVTKIGGCAFRNCTALKHVYIPANVTTITAWAACPGPFYGCTPDLAIYCGADFEPSGWGYDWDYYNTSSRFNVVVFGCTKADYQYWTTLDKSVAAIEIPEGITVIPTRAFYGYTGLTSIEIPESVKSIGNDAFSGCTSLDAATYAGTMVQWMFMGYTYKAICSDGTSVANGTCGTGLKWALNGNGVLTIAGTGAMTDYSSYYSVPWYEYRSDIKTVVISNGVTSIGNEAFYDCSNLTSVTIPSSVTSIGSYAFSYCRGLTSITIPNSVTSIGDSAFYYCSNLTSVTIPSSVTSIGDSAFYNCSGLTSITIPNSVTSIGISAFYNCSGLTSITIPNGVTSIGIYTFYNCSGLTSITIPNSVTSIGSYAFYNCSGLTSITIPNSVTSIGSYAFSYCRGLTSITIPNSVTSIGGSAFYNCSGLTSITYKGTIDQWASIGYSYKATCSDGTSVANGTCGTNLNWALASGGKLIIIGTGAMKDDSSYNFPWYSYRGGIKTVSIGEGVTSIGTDAFYDYSNLTSVTIPSSVTSIGNYAFYYCSNLTSVTIPNSVTTIGYRAFYSCSKLKSVTFTGTTDQWVAAGYGEKKAVCTDGTVYGFGSCGEALSWKLVDGVLTITGSGEMTSHPWSYESTITAVNLPDGVTSIGSNAFYNCTGLKSVTIPSSVTTIGYNAFENCTGLKSIYIPKSVTSISASSSANSPFYGCSSTLEIYCEADAVQSDWGAYWNYYTSDSTLTANFDCSPTDYAYWSTLDKTQTVIEIPEGITSIPRKAFYNCTSLTSVTIPSSVTSIGSSAFYNCASLTEVAIPASVTSIGSSAFSNTTVTYNGTMAQWAKIGYNYKAICSDGTTTANGTCGTDLIWILTENGELIITGTGAMTDYSYSGTPWYSYRSSIKTVSIGDGVTTIDSEAFYYCSNLTSVTIPSSVTTIGYNAFEKCTGLKSIYIPKSVTSISASSYSYSPFYGCSSILEIYCEADTKQSGWGSYWNYYASGSGSTLSVKYGYSEEDYGFWSTLDKTTTTVVIPNGITSIPANALNGFTNLTSVTIPDSVTSIGANAFANCTALKHIYIPGSVKTISAASYSDSPFYGCSSDMEIYSSFSTAPSGWGSYFNYYASGSKLSAWENYSRAEYSFWTSIDKTAESITIPDEISFIPASAFKGNTTLQEIVIPGNIKSIGSQAFYGCTNLSFVTISAGVTSIGSSAFYNCTSLTEVAIPASVTSIGSSAFYNCASLTEVAIPASVTSIGSSAFYNCTSLTEVTIPVSVTSIGSSAFSNTSITYNGTMAQWAKIGYNYKAICSDGTTVANGTCGTDLIWILTESGELIITGTGAMRAYSSSDAPWYSYRSSIKTVFIGEGVTSIGTYAFGGCSDLASIELPASVTSIGNYAFYGCSGLTSIEIPTSVTSIGYEAFNNCSSLTSVTIPSSVTTIGYNAFEKCTGLKSIYIPKSVTSISASSYSSSPFYGCSSNLEIYCEADVKQSGWGSYWNYYASGSYLTTYYSYPQEEYAYWSTLDKTQTAIAIPDGITMIPSKAFKNCTSLKAIYIPVSVTSISASSYSDSPFYGCSSDLEIYCEADAKQSGWGSYWNYYSSSSKLTTNYSCSREDYAYWSTLDKTQTEIVIPDGITMIPAKAFYNCTGLTSVEIPASVTVIGSGAFSGCSSLDAVTYVGTMAQWASIGYSYKAICSDGTNIASGKYGNAVNWRLSEDGVLTVTGTGAMKSSSTSSPWTNYRNC